MRSIEEKQQRYEPMSRPRKHNDDKRVFQLNIRLTASERATLNVQAKGSGLTPANWIRRKIFTGKFPTPRMAALDISTYQELRKIGVNLNQATRKLNQGDYPRDYRTLQLQLASLLDRVLRLLFHDRQYDQG